VVDMNMEDVNDGFCLYVFCLQRSLSRSKKGSIYFTMLLIITQFLLLIVIHAVRFAR